MMPDTQSHRRQGYHRHSYGRSQAGRYLKHHLNLGMNEDESGRKLWDGANPDTGGRFGGFNVRFAQPGTSPSFMTRVRMDHFGGKSTPTTFAAMRRGGF
jgi:hypothetical protein